MSKHRNKCRNTEIDVERATNAHALQTPQTSRRKVSFVRFTVSQLCFAQVVVLVCKLNLNIAR